MESDQESQNRKGLGTGPRDSAGVPCEAPLPMLLVSDRFDRVRDAVG